MKPLRVLIISLCYYPRFIGGAEVAVKEITDRIAPGLVEFDMITLRKQAPAFERVGNVNVYRVGATWFGANTRSSRIFPLSKILFVPLALFKAIRLHRANAYDATWSIMASYAGFAAALFKRKDPKVPFILTIQEGDNFERRQGVFKSLFKKIFKLADRITAISNYLSQWSRGMGAVCPIEVIPNGVDYEHFASMIETGRRKELRDQLGFSDDDVVLVTASRLVHKNAVDDIISSLQYLPTNVKLLVLGTGADAEKLRSQAFRLSLNYDGREGSGSVNRVVFKGFVPHSELPEYLGSSEVFIRPSRSEGLGNSFLEAMAAGIPVIGTATGGIVDFLRNGETGLVCEMDNPKSIAQKVEKLMKDRESRDYIVKNASVLVKQKYGWEGIAVRMKSVLEGSRTS